MRNIRNGKGGSRKSATTSNRERSTIGSKNTNRKRKRSKRGKRGRIRRHVKRSSRIQNPRRCTCRWRGNSRGGSSTRRSRAGGGKETLKSRYILLSENGGDER
jgi:hypothetical protein